MIQLQVLNKVLSDKSLSLLNNNGVTGEYFPTYQEEYDFIARHVQRYGNVPDDETMLEAFQEFELLDVMESDQYLIEKLREEHLFNQLVPILQQAADEMQTDSSEAIENVLPKLEKLLQTSKFVGGVDVAKNASERFNWAMDIKDHEGDLLGVPTGFELLDDLLGGMLPGEDLIVIVGRPGQGKSWTLDRMMANAWSLGKKVLLYSGEMSEMQVGARIDTLLSNISINSITKGIWNDRQLDAYEAHIEDMEGKDLPFIVVTPSMLGGRNLTPALLDAMVQKYKPDVIGIDQLSLMAESVPSREHKRIQYANITMDLYKMSAKYGIPVVLNVQAGRAAKNGMDDVIQLEHIAESDGVGQNASRVITMKRDEAKGILELSLVKNRYGEDNKTIQYIWDITTGTYTLIGYKEEDGDDDRPSPTALRARQSTDRLREMVGREGVEAF